MVQIQLFEAGLAERIVNVASVPQRSPFRYPGGKTWLVPRIRLWLGSLPWKPEEFIEPFAGGGIVGLTVAFERLAEKVTLVELDEDVAAVWQVMLGGDAQWLANRVASFPLTVESAREEMGRSPKDVKERAFQTLLKNRTYHGGILAPGSSLLKHGENGKGIRSRWYPETLVKRILDIGKIRDRIRFIHGDGLEVLRQNAGRPQIAVFVDPPYTASEKRAGSRLYKYSNLDHDALFGICAKTKGQFLMTYDNAPEIAALAIKYGFNYQQIRMQNTHLAKMTELLVGRELGWTRPVL